MLVAVDIAFHGPEDALMIVGVRYGDDAHAGVFLHILHVGLVVLVLSVVQLVVFVVPHQHIARNVEHQLATVAQYGRNHARALVELLADVGDGDFAQFERLDLVHHLLFLQIHESVHLLAEEFIQTVAAVHGTARLVQVGFAAHPIDAALFALVVQLLGRFHQDVFDEAPLDSLRAFAVQIAYPSLLQLLQVAELVGKHHGEHADGLIVEFIVALHHVVEVAARILGL